MLSSYRPPPSPAVTATLRCMDLPHPSPLCVYVEREKVVACSPIPFSCAWVGDIPLPTPPRTFANIHSLCLQESAPWQKKSRPKSRTTRPPLLTAASPTRTRLGTAGRTTWVSRARGWEGMQNLFLVPHFKVLAYLLPAPQGSIHPRPLFCLDILPCRAHAPHHSSV